MRDDARDLVPAGDGTAWTARRDGPFRRAIRLHPRRGAPAGWGTLEAVPWSAAGRFHRDDLDPGGLLDYHGGLAYPQDAASQVPVLLLDPRPGEVVVDCCAAPGSKTTQIALALGDRGLVVACDPSAPRRALLAETLARQGATCALVTPMDPARLAERHPGAADAVLVDAPCSGHGAISPRQVARQALRQRAILAAAAALVRPGGRLVYSTCSPHPQEDEEVVADFLAAHPGWRCRPSALPGCDRDLAGLGALRLWPHRQGTEPFFAALLAAPGDAPAAGFPGQLPASHPAPAGEWAGLHLWLRGGVVLAASPEAAAAGLPSDARGLLLGRPAPDGLRWEPWAAQAAVARGAPAERIPRREALALWAGGALPAALAPHAFLATADGLPLGRLDGEG
ncbi:MAG: RsmB/NOP family class I SAM-dependent RNA methyltransferase, partial [Planctomycetes bacterium]|nr:RsmB/NOP family class I SAM-dependent RNA methyltransferase [Planctomycetota bacterium]